MEPHKRSDTSVKNAFADPKVLKRGLAATEVTGT